MRTRSSVAPIANLSEIANVSDAAPFVLQRDSSVLGPNRQDAEGRVRNAGRTRKGRNIACADSTPTANPLAHYDIKE
jgi:hypothetical protein